MHAALLDALPIGVFALDSRRRILIWNRWLVEHTGIVAASAYGKTLTELFPGVINSRFDMALEHVLRLDGPQILSQALHRHLIPIELPHRSPQGQGLMRQHVHIDAVSDDGQTVAVVSIMDVTGSVTRIEALTDIAQRLESDVNRDPLTQLFNRRFVWEWLEHQHKQALRYEFPLAAIMLDIDHFKSINDQHGHLVGDKVLQDFAVLTAVCLREADILSRFGGEEFLILLPRCDQELAIKVAERIVHHLRASSLGALPAGSITVSAGVSVMDPIRPCLPEELLQRADRFLYQAKSGGRNHVVHAM